MTDTTERRPFLTAEWRSLVMLSYEIDPAVLVPLVPRGTALDLWKGRALVSVVGFRFLRTRACALPLPLHGAFDEINLRFYVRRSMPNGEVRHGVTFVREIVARRAIALAARLTYNEPYRTVPMRSSAPPAGAGFPGRYTYEWRSSGRWHRVAATAVAPGALPPDDADSTFITEHHWGYTQQRDGRTVEYRVAHPRWRVWNAESPELEADVHDMFGAAFASSLGAAPVSAFVAEGSAVAVYWPETI